MIEKPKPLMLPFPPEDYVAQEPRVMANYYIEPKLCSDPCILQSDVYRALAAQRLNKPLEEVTSKERKAVKRTLLALAYNATTDTVLKEILNES